MSRCDKGVLGKIHKPRAPTQPDLPWAVGAGESGENSVPGWSICSESVFVFVRASFSGGAVGRICPVLSVVHA